MFPEQGGLEYDAGVLAGGAAQGSPRIRCFALPGNDAVGRTTGGRSPQPAAPSFVYRERA